MTEHIFSGTFTPDENKVIFDFVTEKNLLIETNFQPNSMQILIFSETQLKLHLTIEYGEIAINTTFATEIMKNKAKCTK